MIAEVYGLKEKNILIIKKNIIADVYGIKEMGIKDLILEPAQGESIHTYK